MNILVSACLMGVECKYDGKCQNIPEFQEKLMKLMAQHTLIPFCPEVQGGLETPRTPAEIMNCDGDLDVKKVVTQDGRDVTDEYVSGAQKALAVAQTLGCQAAILKQRSPSCGSGKIYDGTFSHTVIDGDGITAEMLKENGIAIYTEENAEELL